MGRNTGSNRLEPVRFAGQHTAHCVWIAGEKNSFAQGTAGAILKKPKALEVCVTHHPKAVLYSASGVRSFFRSGKKGRSIPKDTRQNRTNR